MSESHFTFVDLFAGIGGFHRALSEFGGTCVMASEIDKFCCTSYRENYGIEPVGDIQKIEVEEIPDHTVLAGGFPCQPFSLAGVSKYNSLGYQHGFNHETKGTLFFDVARVIEAKRPAAFILENVRNLVSHDSGRTFRVIQRTLRNELSYDVHTRIIDARSVVPQHRERVFIVGFRSDIAEHAKGFVFPDLSSATRPALRDILQPEVDPKYTLTEHLWRYLRDYAEKHRLNGNGFGFGLVDPSDPSVTARTLSARYYKDGSEILIDQGPDQIPRRLTPRECARLMGFPDEQLIPVSDTQAYKQFGNSVVVPVVRAVAGEVVRVLESAGIVSRQGRPDLRQLSPIVDSATLSGDGATGELSPTVAVASRIA